MVIDLGSIFVYETFFTRLCFRLLFIEFQSLVLTMLNVASTQLHLNSWAFVRAFEMLSTFLGREAITGVFFSFFQSKGVSKGSWVSLNGLPRKKLLKAFDSLYKNFKVGYFKVASR